VSCWSAEVEEIARPHPIGLVSPADFVLGERAPFEESKLLIDPRYSLYCFDLANDSALFVECPDPEQLERAAFFYQAQAAQAVAVISLPLRSFHRLAEEIPRKEVIWVHSVGRCGSTLMSKVLATVSGILSLSEPDDLTQLLQVERSLVPSLMQSSMRWRGLGDRPVVAIKTRSEVIILADVIADLFPDAKHLFLYRNGVDWMNTLYRAWPEERDFYDKELNLQMAERWAETVPLVREYSDLNPVGIRMLAWISCMEGFLRLRERRLDTLAVRFEDMVQQPRPTLAKVFEFLGVAKADWSEIEQVLGQDSQAGTVYDREERYKSKRELTEELRREIYELVATRPLLGSPYVVL
jgi:hypothetical protein